MAEIARKIKTFQLGEHLASNTISYKTDVLQRARVSQKKRWAAALQSVKEYLKRLWNTSNVPQHHHLQCMTSSKDSEKLELRL